MKWCCSPHKSLVGKEKNEFREGQKKQQISQYFLVAKKY
jgi:hypothetical protein